MVEFRIRINPEQRLAYIPKEIVEAIGCELKATPNKAAVLLYSQNISVKDILKSLDIIRQDLEHGLELSKDKETQQR
jgi:hypothetical protein